MARTDRCVGHWVILPLHAGDGKEVEALVQTIRRDFRHHLDRGSAELGKIARRVRGQRASITGPEDVVLAAGSFLIGGITLYRSLSSPELAALEDWLAANLSLQAVVLAVKESGLLKAVFELCSRCRVEPRVFPPGASENAQKPEAEKPPAKKTRRRAAKAKKSAAGTGRGASAQRAKKSRRAGGASPQESKHAATSSGTPAGPPVALGTIPAEMAKARAELDEAQVRGDWETASRCLDRIGGLQNDSTALSALGAMAMVLT